MTLILLVNCGFFKKQVFLFCKLVLSSKIVLIKNQNESDIKDDMDPLPLPEKIYFLGERVRLRYIALSIAIFSLFSWALSNTSIKSYDTGAYGLSLIQTAASATPSVNMDEETSSFSQTQADVYTVSFSDLGDLEQESQEAKIKVAKPTVKPSERMIQASIQFGDGLSSFLGRYNIGPSKAYAVVEAFKEYYDPRQVKAGEEFKLHMAEIDGEPSLLSLEYRPSIVESIIIAQNADGQYTASKEQKKIVTEERSAFFSVQSSLYGSAAESGLPDGVIMNLIHLYSWKVDFQRDIQSGDSLKVLYEAEMTEDGIPTNKYNILYASMNLKGQDVPIYRFEDKDGMVDFYTPDGKSIRQGLLKTPLAFGRMSSGFGMRRHPVLGYNKLHKGVDFAATTGTKIYAAADGIIEKKYYSNSYGRYILLRHTGSIKSAYAHMSRFAKGLNVGSRVKQGQVIGYVGTTGRSTGPHLHYEVLKNGQHVNPKSVDLPTQNELKGKSKKQFDLVRISLDRRFYDHAKDEMMTVASRAKD